MNSTVPPWNLEESTRGNYRPALQRPRHFRLEQIRLELDGLRRAGASWQLVYPARRTVFTPRPPSRFWMPFLVATEESGTDPRVHKPCEKDVGEQRMAGWPCMAWTTVP